MLSDDPPVYLVRDYLSSVQCASLIDAATCGGMATVSYEQQVSVNTDRLQLLTPLIAGAALPPVSHAIESGAEPVAVAMTGAAALLGAVLAAAGLTAAVRRGVELASPGFRGKKMDALTASGEAADAVETMLSQVITLVRARHMF